MYKYKAISKIKKQKQSCLLLTELALNGSLWPETTELVVADLTNTTTYSPSAICIQCMAPNLTLTSLREQDFKAFFIVNGSTEQVVS